MIIDKTYCHVLFSTNFGFWWEVGKNSCDIDVSDEEITSKYEFIKFQKDSVLIGKCLSGIKVTSMIAHMPKVKIVEYDEIIYDEFIYYFFENKDKYKTLINTETLIHFLLDNGKEF